MSTHTLPTEVVTRALVQDVRMPGAAGTMALVTLDNGHDHTKPNTFGPQTVAGLQTTFERLTARAAAGEVQAVAITGKPFVFAVGADLTAIPAVTGRDQALEVGRAGHREFSTLMDLPVPTFAFVNGAAMGGGVEIALACDYRTISAGVPAVALPQCFLGLVPGWGGCWMLPHVIVPAAALKVFIENPLSQNTMLSGPAAFKLGMADAMFAPVDFLEESVAWAAAVVSGAVTIERADHTTDADAWAAATKAATKVVLIKTAGSATWSWATSCAPGSMPSTSSSVAPSGPSGPRTTPWRGR